MRSERGLSAGFAGARACEGNKADELFYVIKISDEVSFTSSNIYSDIPPLVYITEFSFQIIQISPRYMI